MESLTKYIKTYIHHLSVFYCKKPSISENEIDEKVLEIEEFIKNIFND